MQQREIGGTYTREAEFQREAIKADDRTVQVAISSEAPVERWFGTEILDHGKGAVDLGRMKSGGPVLMDHNTRDQIGVVEDIKLDGDRVLRGTLRFSKSARAQEIFQDVQDGIRSKISVGYNINRYEITKGSQGAPDTIRATRWTPMEVSFVAVPADDSVGVGRSLDPEDGSVSTTTATPTAAHPEVRMEPTPNTPAAPEAVNIEQIRTRATQEALQSLELGRALGLESEAREMVAANKPAAEINGELLKLKKERGSQPVQGASLEGLGLTPKEAREYSYARALFAAIEDADGGKQSKDYGFEREVSEALLKRFPTEFKRHGGIVIPFTRTGLDSATSTAGAELKYTQYGGEMIELLRNMSGAVRMGARVINGLSSPISFPKQTAGSAASWIASENPGSDVAESDATFGSVSLSPKTLQATTAFSRQLQILGVVDAESIIRNDLAQAHALAWDRAVFHGTGSSGQPDGLYHISGTNSKAMGGAVAFGELIDMVTECAIDNAMLGTTGFITTPGMAGKLRQTLEFSAAGSGTIWEGTYEKGTIGGYNALATNQISSVMTGSTTTGGSEHGIIFGNWDCCLIGTFGPGLEIIVDPYRLKKQAMIEVTSFGMTDIAFRHVVAFCKATGATLA